VGAGCTRFFNGQVYITSTSGTGPSGAPADALCGTNAQEVSVDRGNTGGVSTFPCGSGARYDAVRLYDGANLSELMSVGLTITSNLPLYVEGDWNTAGIQPPTLVMAPRVTLLSSSWKDDGTGSDNGDIHFHGSILAGQPGFGSGPITQVIRTVEDGVDLDLRGALVSGFTTTVKTDSRGFADVDWRHPAELTSPVVRAQPPGVPRVSMALPSTTSPIYAGGVP
jgi:hypothetical protein